ncbi:MAG: MAPEG family protein [Candidatus Paracaedibacter sp.]
MALQATLFYSGILGCLYIYLSVEVTKLRLTHDVHLGDGGHMDLFKAIRIHGNFSEYVPFTLFLLLLCELIGGRPWMIHALSLTFIVARLLHIIGLRKLEGPSIYRFLGATLTWCVISVLSIFCLISAF